MLKWGNLIIIGLMLTIACPSMGRADTCKERPLTDKESNFYVSTDEAATKAFRLPEGWRIRNQRSPRDIGTVCLGFENMTMENAFSITFEKISEKEKEAQALREKMKKSAMSGNREDLEKQAAQAEAMQKQDSAEMQKQMAQMMAMMNQNGPNGKKSNKNGVMQIKRVEQILLAMSVSFNGEGYPMYFKKDLEVVVPGAIKAFDKEVKGRTGPEVRRVLFLGKVEVSPHKDNQWQIKRGKVAHDEVGAVMVELRGKRPFVEEYMKEHMNLEPLLSLVNH